MPLIQNSNRPVSCWQANFDTGANAGYPASWKDLTGRVEAWSTTSGKQRELGIAQAGTASLLCSDVDEWLNPANTSSPWNSGGNLLKLYRQVRHWEMPAPWTGNLLNSTNNIWVTVRGDTGSYADTASFEGGTVGSWNVNGTGATVANSATRAHDGTKSMLVTWPTQTGGGIGGNAQVSSSGVPLKTGLHYVLSAWIWIVAGPTVQMFCNGQTVTSTSTTGAWQQLVLPFTAQDAGGSNLWFYPTTSTTAGQTVFIDSVQLEYTNSNTPSAFSSSGPTIFPQYHGYIERYPNTWQYAGFRGYCQLQLTDALGMMPRVNLLGLLESEVNADAPSFWWGFDDGIGPAGIFNQKGGTKDPLLRQWTGINATATGGASSYTSSPGNIGPSPDMVECLQLVAAWISPNAYPALPDLGAAYALGWTGSQIGGTAAGFGVEFYFMTSAASNWTQRLFETYATGSTNNKDTYQFSISATSNKLTYAYYNSSGTNLESLTSTPVVTDGVWHHVYFHTSSNGTTITSQLWLDGVSVGTQTRSGASIPVRNGMLIGTSLTTTGSFAVSNLSPTTGFLPFHGNFSNLALYQGGTTLSASRISAHATAASQTAFDTDTTGTRLKRVLSYAGWGGAGNSISTSAGVAVGPLRGMAGKYCADILKITTDTDQGLLVAGPSGLLDYTPQSSIASQSSVITFGENVGGGEISYRDDAHAELEPSSIYNSITVNPYSLANPDQYLTPVVVIDSNSQLDYGVRSYSLDILPVSGSAGLTQIQSMAAFLLAQKKDPRVMVPSIIIPAGALPQATWAQLLALRIGNTATFKRRPNQSLTLTVTGYIQSINWSETPNDGAVVTIALEPIQV